MLFFEKIIDCGVINIFGVVITTLSCILAVIFYLKSRKRKKPCYEMYSINLLNSELKHLKDIEIIYKGNYVKNLTATKLAFWNAGNETIDKSDIPESAPLTITGNNGTTIYHAEVISSSDASNQIRIEENNIVDDSDPNAIDITESYIIKFDYLDQWQKGEIRILHSGISDKDIIVTGKVKGAGNFKDANTKNPFSKFINYLFVFVFNAGFGAILYSIIFNEKTIIPSNALPYISIILIILLPITLVFFSKEVLGYKIYLKKVKK